jgi:hypothetical protein
MFDPREFLLLSAQLCSGPSNEAASRTAVGRAYYACHLIARDQLYGPDGRLLTNARRKRFENRWSVEGGSHEFIVAGVAHSVPSSLGRAKRLSDRLAQLKDMRVQADYKCDPQDTNTQAIFARYGVTDWQSLATQALQLANSLFPELRRLQIMPGP